MWYNILAIKRSVLIVFVKMNNIHNIIAIGGHDDNQSRFLTQIKPVKLKEDAEIAITSIYHGQIFNITNENNKVYFHMMGISELSGNGSELQDTLLEQQVAVIPIGFYPSSHALCLAIEDEIAEVSKTPRRIGVAYDRHRQLVQLRLSNLYIKNKIDSPWRLLGVQNDFMGALSLQNINFDEQQIPVFVYINIIENSYINGKLSRIASVIPLKSNPGWNFFQQAHPSFVSINVKEFSNILIELRDITGKFLVFDPAFKTIVTLKVQSSTLYKESN